MAGDSEWLAALLEGLARGGPAAAAAGRYIRHHNVRVGIHAQNTGARWRLGRRIELHPRYLAGSPDAVYPVSLLIHEVRHLQQGTVTALSVYGETAAWRAQFEYVAGRTGRFHDVPEKDLLIKELLSLPAGWRRSALSAARRLMRRFAGPAYRVDLLPLYPAPREIAWLLFRTEPKASLEP